MGIALGVDPEECGSCFSGAVPGMTLSPKCDQQNRDLLNLQHTTTWTYSDYHTGSNESSIIRSCKLLKTLLMCLNNRTEHLGDHLGEPSLRWKAQRC